MRIALVQMPPASLFFPALGITQLRSVVQAACGERASTEILYLNHDFALHLARELGTDAGVAFYDQVFDLATGMGDWFFRQAAFPSEPDNAAAYLRRYYPGKAKAAFRERVQAVRAGVGRFLDEVIDRYRLDRADLVGFSSMFQQNVASFALARRLKERNQDVTIVIGGTNCETPMGEEIVRNVDAIDYVFSGHSLVSLPRFVLGLLDGKTEELGAIPGVFGVDLQPRELRQRVGEELDIDADVPLDYDSFFESIESKFPGGEVVAGVMFETSRGCWWGARAHCKFCGLNGVTMEYRAMQPEKAVALIQSLFDRYGSKTRHFRSVDNIMPVEYPDEVFARLKTPPDAEIFFEMKADVSEEDIATMAKAGVTLVNAGIESLSTSQLKAMKKGTTAFTNLKALKNFLLHGVTLQWNLLVGMPDERAEMYAKYVSDLPRAVHLSPPSGTAAIRYDRYSPYFNDAADYGVELGFLEYYDYIYPFGQETLNNLAYHFYDRNFSAPYVQTLATWFGKVQGIVAQWQARWNGQAGLEPPQLFLKTEGGTTVIYDSRSGTPRELEVTDTRRAVLDFLERPRDRTSFERFAERERFDAASELAFLDEHELVWHEGARFMSLVLPRRPESLHEAQKMSKVAYDEHGRPIGIATESSEKLAGVSAMYEV